MDPESATPIIKPSGKKNYNSQMSNSSDLLKGSENSLLNMTDEDMWLRKGNIWKEAVSRKKKSAIYSTTVWKNVKISHQKIFREINSTFLLKRWCHEIFV